jgi:hypothetical protein
VYRCRWGPQSLGLAARGHTKLRDRTAFKWRTPVRLHRQIDKRMYLRVSTVAGAGAVAATATAAAVAAVAAVAAAAAPGLEPYHCCRRAFVSSASHPFVTSRLAGRQAPNRELSGRAGRTLSIWSKAETTTIYQDEAWNDCGKRRTIQDGRTASTDDLERQGSMAAPSFVGFT